MRITRGNAALSLAVAWLAAASVAAGAADSPDAASAQIGATQIAVPAPAGFVEPSRAVPPLRELGETMTPATNRMIAMFVTSDDLAKARAGKPPSMQRYFFVQTFRQTEARDLSAADFAKIKDVLRNQTQQLVGRAALAVQGQLASAVKSIGDKSGNPGLSMKVGEVKVQDLFEDSENSITVIAITKYAIQNGGKTQETPVAMSMTTALVRGKIVYFYAYSLLSSPDDIDWVRTQGRQWLPRMNQQNR